MRKAIVFISALLALLPARAEFRQIDLTIYGMD
jgi:hypothetical protein